MRITKYGLDVVSKILLILLAANALTFAFVQSPVIRLLLGLVSIALLAFTLYFFRDPDRNIPSGENFVLAPGDGKIVRIAEVEEKEFLGGTATMMSIFLSPLDVHVNRFPISGTVTYFKYFPGKYIVAYDHKSSETNERTHIGIERGSHRVLFKQIAGYIARRIVANITEGMPAVAGERFGMIKFGSRIDVFVSSNSDINVTLNQRVVAGETVLAVLK